MITLSIYANDGLGQRIILETAFGGQSYNGADNTYESSHFKIGIERKNNMTFDLSIVSSKTNYEIRMQNVNVTKFNLDGFIIDILTGKKIYNWREIENKRVYKPYSRSMTSFNFTVGKLFFNRLKLFAGPSMRLNSITSVSTNEMTFKGSLFSDMEFEDYTNYGMVTGLDYMQPLIGCSYLLLDVQLQADLLSTSNKIAKSRFMASSITYGIGIGFRMGVKSKNKGVRKRKAPPLDQYSF